MLPRILPPILLAVLGSGCAANLSTLQTTDTLDPGQVRIGAGVGFMVHKGAVEEAIDLSDRYADELAAIERGEAEPPTEAEFRDILRTAASLAVFPPEPVGEVGVRLGLLDGFDVGLKWSTSAWRVDGKIRLTPEASPAGVAIFGGAELYTFDVGLFDLEPHLREVSSLFEYVSLEDPKRYDAEAGLLVDLDVGPFLTIYAAGRYRAGAYRLPIVVTVEGPDGTYTARETLTGVLHYGGGTLGFAVGPPLLQLFVEMNVGGARSETDVMDRPEELGGLIFYPAVGLVLRP